MAPNPEEAFDAIVRRDVRLPDTATGRMFGSDGLKVRGKVYAMLVKKQLVLKLPASRIEKLVASRKGVAFDPGHGRVMNEWIALSPAQATEWRKLTSEARRFVESIS